MTEDKGIRDMLGFLLARDKQHQLQWIEAIKELEAKEGIVVPGTVPEKYEVFDVTHTLYNFSVGEDSKPVVDGKEAADGNEFKYIKNPQAMADKPVLKAPPAKLHSTPSEK
ncbi:hypothetical protein IRB23M11_19330 [Alkalibacterium sp. m-11]